MTRMQNCVCQSCTILHTAPIAKTASESTTLVLKENFGGRCISQPFCFIDVGTHDMALRWGALRPHTPRLGHLGWWNATHHASCQHANTVRLTTVRDPVDRFLSLFRWFRPRLQQVFSRNYSHPIELLDDASAMRKLLVGELGRAGRGIRVHFMPMHFWVVTKDGRPKVDALLRFSHLEADVTKVIELIRSSTPASPFHVLPALPRLVFPRAHQTQAPSLAATRRHASMVAAVAPAVERYYASDYEAFGFARAAPQRRAAPRVWKVCAPHDTGAWRREAAPSTEAEWPSLLLCKNHAPK